MTDRCGVEKYDIDKHDIDRQGAEALLLSQIKLYPGYFEICRGVDRLLGEKDRVIVAIDGNSGAGKSSLASLIAGIYKCDVFHMDDYFLPPELKTPERLALAGGNVDYARFRREVLEGINSGREFQYRRYDCRKATLEEATVAVPGRLHIVEGCYSMHPELIGYYDLKIFLGIGKEEQKRRILQRNGADMLKRFINEWIPLEDKYFAELGIRGKSDIVMEGTGINKI